MDLMVRRLTILAASLWLALLGGLAEAADPPAAAGPALGELPAATADTAAAPAPGADQARPVKEVTLDPTLKPPVCRRYAPTGSRISTERCQSAESWDAARAADRSQTHRDIDEMRMRQAMRDQQRAAQTEAMRRRGGL
ncbi:MAG TPA: hypothetical protein VLI71_17015 [Gammaproteobacteria bacterium]|nr:hypothetical protein [Gammaproteobacteria bacterium]